MTWANLSNSTSGPRKQWARVDESGGATGARAQARKTVLQKALRPKTSNWVDDCLPLEDPASHRKANCRVAKMHHFHIHPQSDRPVSSSGEIPTSSSIGTIATRDRVNKAHQCHGSGTEVIGRSEVLGRDEGREEEAYSRTEGETPSGQPAGCRRYLAAISERPPVRRRRGLLAAPPPSKGYPPL